MVRNPLGQLSKDELIMYLRVELEMKKEKLEAIQSLIDGEYDNEHLLKIGSLYPDFQKNVEKILSH